MDIRLTSDKEIVCHHDKSALRTTGLNRYIKEMSLKELRSLDCGGWFGENWKGEKIPKLEEILRILPVDKDIFIEVKTKEEMVPYLLESIMVHGKDIDHITVISFYPGVIKEIKKRAPEIKCNLLIAFDHQEVEVDSISVLANSINADGIGAQNHSQLNEEFVRLLKERKKSVHVWTVNSKKEAEEYLQMGVDSITTNRPKYLRDHLELFQSKIMER